MLVISWDNGRYFLSTNYSSARDLVKKLLTLGEVLRIIDVWGNVLEWSGSEFVVRELIL